MTETTATNGAKGVNGTTATTIDSARPRTSALLPHNTSDIIAGNYVHQPRPIKVIFIGAGISGIAFAYKANQVDNLSYTIYEKNADVGGTWLDSRYPGVACDVPAHGYTYTWRGNPDWSRFYAGGEEIWAWYAKLAREYGVYEKTRFRHRVTKAEWDEGRQVWDVTVEDLETGRVFVDSAEMLINGGGPLSHWKWPDIEGLHDFKGSLLHTAAWDDSVKLDGKTVAVIGSGASGIQIVPQIQPIARKLVSFNRSPTWIAPDFAWQMAPQGHETVFTEEQKAGWRADPASFRRYRQDIEHAMNSRFPSFYKHSAAQRAGRAAVADMMRKRLHRRPELVDKLIPEFELGCRRVTPGEGYLEALTADNAEVVTCGIARVVADGIVDNDGVLHRVDVIVAATGYETSFVPRFPILGLNGRNLQDKWRDEGAAAYLAVAVPGFPNYFLTLGPNAPISNGSLIGGLEKQLDFALAFAHKIQTEDVTSAVVREDAAAEFEEWKNEMMKGLTWSGNCTSWYKNGTADGKVIGPWPGSVNHFMEIMRRPRYEDFDYKFRTRNRFRYFGDGRAPVEARGEHLGWYMQ